MQAPIKVLVVDDEEPIRRNFRSYLEDSGHTVVEASNGEEGLAVFQREHPTLVLTDLRMGKMTGLELLTEIIGASPNTPVVVVSGTGTVRDAIAAIRLGAWDYVLKPLQNAGELDVVVHRTLERLRLQIENRAYREHLEEQVLQRTNELRHRNRELALLNRIMAATAAEKEPAEVLEIACRELALGFDLSLAIAFLADTDAYQVTVVHASPGCRVEPEALQPVPRSHSWVQALINQKGPWVVTATDDPWRSTVLQDAIKGQVITAFLALPLMVDERLEGWIMLGASNAGRFAGDEVAMAWNVTQQAARSLAYSQLTDTRRRLMTAIEQTPISIVIANLKGEMIYVNPTFERITGYSRVEAIGQNSRILKSGKHDEAFYRELWGKITRGEVWSGRIVNQKKDGTQYMEEATIAPVLNIQGAITHYIAVRQDITERNKMEAQILRLQRVESVGRLANGIAHDLNNVLTPILMSVEMISDKGDNAHVDELVRLIRTSAQRGADMVKQLLFYSRGIEANRAELDLREAVREMVRMVRETFPKSIQIRTYFAEELWPIMADGTQLHQVLLNLCVNARDAMPDGGILSIGAENVELNELAAKTTPDAKPGAYVVLNITDSGTGIAPDILDKIFDPFFSTKQPGQGTGLGLSTVLGIVRSHGGFLQVQSVARQGSEFKIYLPALAGAGKLAPVDAEPAGVAGSGETIMVVDDEASVRLALKLLLESRNYRVVLAEDGFEALALMARQRKGIHAAIVDLWMPFMDGTVTLREIHKQNPALPMIAVSGLINPPADFERNSDKRAFLPKPWTASQLLSTLHRLLEGARPL